MKRTPLFWFFLAPVALWLLLLIVLPHLDLLVLSFRAGDAWTLANYRNFFNEPIYWLTFVRTAVYAILTTVLTLLLALPVAFYITKLARQRQRGFLLALVLLPFWVSELVRIYGWMILLRESGVINHFLLFFE